VYGDRSLRQSKTAHSHYVTFGPSDQKIWSLPISFSHTTKTKPMKFFTILIIDGFIKREWSGMTCSCSSLGITHLMKLRVSSFSLWRLIATVSVRCLTDSVCPHSAFMDPSIPKGTPSRVSIEVRAIIIGWSMWQDVCIDKNMIAVRKNNIVLTMREGHLFRGINSIPYSWIHCCIDQIWIFYGYIRGFMKLWKFIRLFILCFWRPFSRLLAMAPKID
jgi:hypothetical protein